MAQHIRERHEEFKEAQIPIVADICTTPADLDGVANCPLCQRPQSYGTCWITSPHTWKTWHASSFLSMRVIISLGSEALVQVGPLPPGC